MDRRTAPMLQRDRNFGALPLFSSLNGWKNSQPAAKDLAGSVVCPYEENDHRMNFMKIQNGIMAALLVLSSTTGFSQSGDASPQERLLMQRAAESTDSQKSHPAVAASGLTRFNLDFPGGKPKELVAAIQKATGKPLNAIVPDELADVKLPPLKMTGINMADLFSALIRASSKTVPYTTSTFYSGTGRPNYSYQAFQTSYGFKTEGPPSDDAIWYFFESKPALPPDAVTPPGRTARFYLLTPYLERGMTVDDITTAIQTGWKMLGEKETPTISFHKETKLLIAVGDATKLDTIDAVLRALEPLQSPGGRRFGGGGGFGGGGFGGPGGRGSTPSTNTTPTEEPKND
jgi:hypothetical protein